MPKISKIAWWGLCDLPVAASTCDTGPILPIVSCTTSGATVMGDTEFAPDSFSGWEQIAQIHLPQSATMSLACADRI